MTEEEAESIRRSDNAREHSIEVFGDKNTQVQVVELLSMIRHAIKNNAPTDITLHIAKSISNGTFLFTVDRNEIDDLYPVKEFSIN